MEGAKAWVQSERETRCQTAADTYPFMNDAKPQWFSHFLRQEAERWYDIKHWTYQFGINFLRPSVACKMTKNLTG